MNKKSNNVKPPGIDIKENLIQKKITIGWLDLKTKLYLPLFFRLFTLLIGGFFVIYFLFIQAILNYQGIGFLIVCFMFSIVGLVPIYIVLANQLNNTTIIIKGGKLIYSHQPVKTYIEKGIIDINKINKIEHKKPSHKRDKQHELLAITKKDDFKLISSADGALIEFLDKKIQSYLNLNIQMSFLEQLELINKELDINPEKKNQKEWLSENISKLENTIEDLIDCEDFLSTIVKIDSTIINSTDWKNKFIEINKSHIEDINDAIDFAKLLIKYLSAPEEAKLILKEYENTMEDYRDLKELQTVALELFDDQIWANNLNEKITKFKKRRKKVIQIQKPNAIKALLINIIIPGLGSLIVGEKKRGQTQLLLFGIGVPLSFIFIGIPLVIIAWLSALSLSIKLIKSSK